MWRGGTQLSVHQGKYYIWKQLWNQLLREFPQVALQLYETNGEHCSMREAVCVYVVRRENIQLDICYV